MIVSPVCVVPRRAKKENTMAFCYLVKHPFCVTQESCARVLLFRGTNKEIKNYNSQTAFQVRLTLNKKMPSVCDASEVNVTFDAACIWSHIFLRVFGAIPAGGHHCRKF